MLKQLHFSQDDAWDREHCQIMNNHEGEFQLINSLLKEILAQGTREECIAIFAPMDKSAIELEHGEWPHLLNIVEMKEYPHNVFSLIYLTDEEYPAQKAILIGPKTAKEIEGALEELDEMEAAEVMSAERDFALYYGE